MASVEAYEEKTIRLILTLSADEAFVLKGMMQNSTVPLEEEDKVSKRVREVIFNNLTAVGI